MAEWDSCLPHTSIHRFYLLGIACIYMKIHVHVYIYTYVCAFASPVGLALWEFHVKKAFLYPICYPSLEAFLSPVTMASLL